MFVFLKTFVYLRNGWPLTAFEFEMLAVSTILVNHSERVNHFTTRWSLNSLVVMQNIGKH